MGIPLDCDDGNPMTEDWCDPAFGCRHEDIGGGIADGTPCDDGNACTINDVYDGGVCSGVALDCDDGDPLTDDWCDPAVGCRHSSAEGVCPRGCECLTEAEADAKFMNFVKCLEDPCGYFAPLRGEPVPKYCYRSAA
ncbi:MAG TPA: hypothetical protein ENN85_06680 [Methanoculleus sp.]|nr:hypothetical protein [Methanoculleus sp.]